MFQELDRHIPYDLEGPQFASVECELEQKPQQYLHFVFSGLHRQTLAGGQVDPCHELHIGCLSGRRTVESSIKLDFQCN